LNAAESPDLNRSMAGCSCSAIGAFYHFDAGCREKV
jgi:hypothetical protein